MKGILFVFLLLTLINGYFFWARKAPANEPTPPQETHIENDDAANGQNQHMPTAEVLQEFRSSGKWAASEDWGDDEYRENGEYIDNYFGGTLSYQRFHADYAVTWNSPKYASYVLHYNHYDGGAHGSDSFDIGSFVRKTGEDFDLKKIFPEGRVREKLLRRLAEEICIRWSYGTNYYSRIEYDDFEELQFPTVTRSKFSPKLSKEDVTSYRERLKFEDISDFFLYRDGWHFYFSAGGKFTDYSSGMEVIVDHIPGEVLP